MEGDSVKYSETEEEEKPVRLSLHLIVKRHLPPEAQKWDQEKMLEALNKITHLRLDRERIKDIDSLELLGDKVTNLYLQSNIIESIENLECLKNLSFITLAHNRIKTIENLSILNKLLFLDLSENQISKVDVGEIPPSVIILNLQGNPCTSYPDYRGRLVKEMPKLRQLDLCEIDWREKRAVGLEVSSDEDSEDDDDDEVDQSSAKGSQLSENTVSIQETATQMMVRSQKRTDSDQKTHKQHEHDLDDLRITWNVPPSSRSTARSSSQR